MSTARKILSNTAWQMLGKVIVSLLGIITVKLITNYLSTGAYGNYTIIYEYIAFFAIAADFGLFTIAVREMSHDERQISKIVGNVLSLRTFLSIVILGIASAIAFFIPKYQGTPIPIGIILAAIATALILINGAVVSVLQTYLKMQYATISLVLGKILIVGYLFLTVFVIYPTNPDLGFYHLLIAGIIGNAGMLILSYFLTRHFSEVHYRFDFGFWKDVLFKAMPYGIALILGTVYFRIDSILLYFMRSSHEVGIYGVPMRILEMLTILPLYFMNSVLPVLTRKIAEKSQKVKEIIQYSFDFLFLAGLPTVVGGVILAFPLIFVVSSTQFLSGWHCTNNLAATFTSQEIAESECLKAEKGFTLPDDALYLADSKPFFYQVGSDIAMEILLISMLLAFLNNIFIFTLVALGKQTKILLINFGGVVSHVLISLFLIPYYGIIGAAVAATVTEAFILLASFLSTKKYLNYGLSLSRAIRAILATTVMGIAVYFLRDPLFSLVQNKNILILIPLGGIIYAAVLWMTKAVSKELFEIVFKREQ